MKQEENNNLQNILVNVVQSMQKTLSSLQEEQHGLLVDDPNNVKQALNQREKMIDALKQGSQLLRENIEKMAQESHKTLPSDAQLKEILPEIGVEEKILELEKEISDLFEKIDRQNKRNRFLISDKS